MMGKPLNQKRREVIERDTFRSLIVALVMCLLLLSLSTIAGEYTQADKFLEFLAGKWRSAYKSAAGDDAVQILTYQWARNNAYLKMHSSHSAVDQLVLASDGFVGINRSNQKLHMHYATSKGPVFQLQEMERGEDWLLFNGTSFGEPQFTRFRFKIIISGADRFQAELQIIELGEWNTVSIKTFDRITE